MLLIAQGVASGGILQAHRRRDIARINGFNILTVIGMHLQNTAQTLVIVLIRVVHRLSLIHIYIMAAGNERVILCERGIRTFETMTRNTLDISAVPLLKSLSHLPVVVDPSHAAGISRLVEPLALAAVAAGADGLIIEVHNDPPHALSDGAQSLTPEQFTDLTRRIEEVAPLFGKTIAHRDD